MASPCALGVVSAAVLTALKASSALIALVPAVRIVDEVPARPTYPYLLVEVGGETPFNTMGVPAALKWGSESTVLVRVVSQYRGDQEACQVLDAAKAAIDGQPLTVAGFASVGVSFASAQLIKDTLAGVVTRELVATFTVLVHQS
jgi:hypothetical protein